MVFVAAIFLSNLILMIEAGYLPTVLWDSRNFLFGCDELTIYMKQNDVLNLACPSVFLYSRQEKEKIKPATTFEKIFIVNKANKDKFYNCNSTGATELKTCKGSDQKTGYKPYKEIQMTRLNGIDILQSIPDKEKTVYIFSTSFQIEENLDKHINGSCQKISEYYPLKLKIHKCKQGDLECESKVCNTMECYLKDCGRWNKWKAEDTFYWNGTKCLQKSTRNCSTIFPCNGEKEKLEIVPDQNCTLYKEECPSTSISSKVSISPTKSSSLPSSELLTSTFSQCPKCSCPSPSVIPISTSLKQSSVIISSMIGSNILKSSVLTSSMMTSNILEQTSSLSSFNVDHISRSKSMLPVSTTTIVVNQTVTTTETKTETVHQVSTIEIPGPATTVVRVETKTERITKSCDNICSKSIEVKPEFEYVVRDISYDEKFYITVISAIIGAILVAVFVMHACISYQKGNKVKNPKVINVQEYREKTTTHIETSSGKPTSNGTYTMLA